MAKRKLTPDERCVQELFRSLGHELSALAPHASRPTPDFEWALDNDTHAVLEVKSLVDQSTALRLDDPDETETDASRDNIAGRVAGKIHQAVKQFADHRQAWKVVVFVNHDICADHSDLREALQGYLDYDDGSQVTTVMPEVLRRMTTDHRGADLFVWVDAIDRRITKVWHGRGAKDLARLLGAT